MLPSACPREALRRPRGGEGRGISWRPPAYNLLLTSCAKGAATICRRPVQVDLLTLKVVSESRVTWATSVPILVFLGLSVLDLGLMYATDRRQTRIIALCPYPRSGGIIIILYYTKLQRRYLRVKKIHIVRALCTSNRETLNAT